MNNKTIPVVIIAVGLLITGVIIYTNYIRSSAEEAIKEQGEVLSLEEAGERVISFIDENILQGQTPISLIETLEEDGLYKVRFKVEEEEVEWRITKNGKLIFPQVIDLIEIEASAEETNQTIGNFSVSSDEICMEDDKPIVYFFGSETCPHCIWERPIIEKVASEFEGYISFHNNISLDNDADIFEKYSDGGVPALVLGCKYYRVGSGENSGQEQEAKNLTSLICELTNNQPAEICQK